MTLLTNDSYSMLPTSPCMDWRLITGSLTVTLEPWCHPENSYHTQHQNTIITLSVIRINELLYLPRIAQFLTYEKNKTSNSVRETFPLVSDSNIQFIARTTESHQWPIALLVGGASGDLPSSVLECWLLTIFCRSYAGKRSCRELTCALVCHVQMASLLLTLSSCILSAPLFPEA